MALKRENEGLRRSQGYSVDELIGLFDTLPQEARTETLKRLAAAEIQRRSDKEQITHSLPEQNTARSVLPPTRSKIEFELMVRHPTAYPIFFPEATPRVQSNAPSSNQAPPSRFTAPFAGDTSDSTYRQGAMFAIGGFNALKSHQIGPQQVLSYCDSRLNRLQISQWTEVPITNDFAAQVISIFLETDHPIQGLFDADLFLEDLVTASGQFCSSFLVTALLFCACVDLSASLERALADSAKSSKPEKLLDSELNRDSLPSLAAISLMSIGCIYQGKDDRAAEFMKDIIRMGQRMNLFGCNIHKAALETFRAMPDDLLRASAHTAWGVYSWVTLYSLHYHEPGARVSPMLPIPGDGTHDQQDKLAIRIASYAPPVYMGQTFTALCKLWTIFQEMILVYYAAEQCLVTERVDVSFARSLYQKLLSWADQLPPSATRQDRSPHHVIILHILYHVAILDVFRPFVNEQQPLQIRSASAANQPADAVFAASVNQLQQLMYIYRTCHRSATYTILWHTAMLYVANALFRDPSDPSLRSIFSFCLEGYRDLVASFPVAEGILRGLLTMAMHLRIISTSYARDILTQAHEKGKHHHMRQDLRANFMVDLNLALSSRENAKVENVARDFEQLAVINRPL
ncbi:MAG: hypothetical protein Q9181_004543 [Wetmoreana brouardii]